MPNGVPLVRATTKQPIPVWLKIVIGAGILFFSLPILGIVAAIAIPGMLRARIAGNEAAAIGSMRAIASAQATYMSSCGGGLYAKSLTVLGKPPADGRGAAFISPDLSTGERVEHAGYRIWIEAAPEPTDKNILVTGPPCNGVGAGDVSSAYIAQAQPVSHSTGTRYFATNASGIVYYSLRPITFGPDGSANEPAQPVQ
jgi:type II secretory pathway pseudopilin PulG